MASKQANKRLMKELVDLNKSPPPFILARPRESDILEWHYILRGPPDTPYEGGEFWGTVVFPPEYPFKPPAIKMLTPSGRFQPDRKICTSMSDYHPASWNPAWSVATILNGLLSFMVSEEMTTGSVRSSDGDRRLFAKRSHSFNVAQPRFRAIFPITRTPKDRSTCLTWARPRSQLPRRPMPPRQYLYPSPTPYRTPGAPRWRDVRPMRWRKFSRASPSCLALAHCLRLSSPALACGWSCRGWSAEESMYSS